MPGNELSGDAIVVSGWGWRTYTPVERMAIVLGRAGFRVLYCDNPTSFLRKPSGKRVALDKNVEGFQPGFLGHRINRLPLIRKWQAKHVVTQLLKQARQMGLERPMALHAHGYWLRDVAREFKARGVFTVYLCNDHLETDDPEVLTEISDLTLVLPRSVYHQLKAKYGDKVRWTPEIGPEWSNLEQAMKEQGNGSEVVRRVRQIPRPRLGYLGPPGIRVHARLVAEVLAGHPEWHLITCGPVAGLNLPNLHDVGWITTQEVAQVSLLLDAGFLPYDCDNLMNLHCVPVKLLDCFAAGLPVVSTPVIHLWECQDLVYLGDTASELADGIQKALAEASDDPRREQRRRIAHAHSIEEMSRVIPAMLVHGVNEFTGHTYRRGGPVRT